VAPVKLSTAWHEVPTKVTIPLLVLLNCHRQQLHSLLRVAADKGEDLVSKDTFAKCIHELGFGDQCIPPQLIAGMAITVAGTTIRRKLKAKPGDSKGKKKKQTGKAKGKGAQRAGEGGDKGGGHEEDDFPTYRYSGVVEYEYFLELLDTEHGRQLMCKISKPKKDFAEHLYHRSKAETEATAVAFAAALAAGRAAAGWDGQKKGRAVVAWESQAPMRSEAPHFMQETFTSEKQAPFPRR
jgi:hypothetical protein